MLFIMLNQICILQGMFLIWEHRGWRKKTCHGIIITKPSFKNVVGRSFASLPCPARISLKTSALTFFQKVMFDVSNNHLQLLLLPLASLKMKEIAMCFNIRLESLCQRIRAYSLNIYSSNIFREKKVDRVQVKNGFSRNNRKWTLYRL